MELTPGERISLIRESATLLDKQEWSEIDLVLEQHGLRTSDGGVWDTKSAYITDMIKNASNGDLAKLHEYLIGEVTSSPARQSPWSGERLRLFCSHLAQHKQIVGQVGDCLARYGIEPFIAHDSIEPSKEWVSVIEAALTDCDAMVVFLHSGFRESHWCDQEVGWAFGRKRPILPLNYGAPRCIKWVW
jgi:TIR domain